MKRTGPASMPYTRTDRLVLMIMESRWFNAGWAALGHPPIAVRMPTRRLPSGVKGFRVLRQELKS